MRSIPKSDAARYRMARDLLRRIGAAFGHWPDVPRVPRGTPRALVMEARRFARETEPATSPAESDPK